MSLLVRVSTDSIDIPLRYVYISYFSSSFHTRELIMKEEYVMRSAKMCQISSCSEMDFFIYVFWKKNKS